MILWLEPWMSTCNHGVSRRSYGWWWLVIIFGGWMNTCDRSTVRVKHKGLMAMNTCHNGWLTMVDGLTPTTMVSYQLWLVMMIHHYLVDHPMAFKWLVTVGIVQPFGNGTTSSIIVVTNMVVHFFHQSCFDSSMRMIITRRKDGIKTITIYHISCLFQLNHGKWWWMN